MTVFWINKKYILPLAIVLILLASGTSLASYLMPPKLFIAGQEIKTDVPPQTIGGRIMVPIRVISEHLGATVNWNTENRAVYIQPKSNAGANTGNNTKTTLTKEEKAGQLKALLIHSVQSCIEGESDRTDIGDLELHYANNYIHLHMDYMKFNAIFVEEFSNRESITPALDEIDRAYINALKTMDYPGTPYDFGDSAQWQDRTRTNFAIVLEVFNRYIVADGKYY